MGDEEEREAFIRWSSGVKQDAFGQFWRYSSYASGGIPGWHPAALARRRGAPQSFLQDLVNGLIFLGLVFGIPAVAFFAPKGLKVPATLGYAVFLGFWFVLATAVTRSRTKKAAERAMSYPHPGPKGHHKHTS